MKDYCPPIQPLPRLAKDEERGCSCGEGRGGRGLAPLTYLMLKRASALRPSGEWSDDDFDVLADGVVRQELAAGMTERPDPPVAKGAGRDLPQRGLAGRVVTNLPTQGVAAGSVPCR